MDFLPLGTYKLFIDTNSTMDAVLQEAPKLKSDQSKIYIHLYQWPFSLHATAVGFQALSLAKIRYSMVHV